MYAKNFGEFFINQVRYADAIVLSRTADMDDVKLNETISLLNKYNTKATKITTPWDKLNGTTILNDIENQHQLKDLLIKEVSYQGRISFGSKEKQVCGCGCGHHHDHNGCGCHENHAANDVFMSWGIETVTKYDYQEIEQFLEMLKYDDSFGAVLRAKGMLECQDGKWMYFDYVPGEIVMREGSPCSTGKSCVIGAKLDEEKLKKSFEK